MPVTSVKTMADYWLVEPPASRLLALHYGYGFEDQSSGTIPPGALTGATPFRKLPRWLQNSLIQKSGLSEVEFYRKLNAKAREQYAKEKPSGVPEGGVTE
jgi:hypothetical protein